ncbi:MAG: toll/interleukin-1 receptor domain-containing protein [Acidobacteria bacterium]|nr:toll/interleukin-1 receptor domain-containing protein [Acidobacteriota bacterium]
MAYVPGCRYDLFISYASENNRDGWVEQFASALGQELGELLGRQFNPKESVFLDKRELEVAQNFSDRLRTAARDSAVLVAVLSPGYLTSDWCNREREEFFSRLPFGATPSDCLAPALMRPVDDAGLDKLYREAQRISFLGGDGQTPMAVRSPEWWEQVRKLAGQLRNALQRLRRNCRPVYLGKTAGTDRLQDLRTWCRCELERRFLRTAPESLQALDDPDAVRASLQEAGLAVHFLGGASPAALEAVEASVEICGGATILYQPFGVPLSDDEQIWLEAFEQGLKVPAGHYQRLAGKNDQELLTLIDEEIARVRDAAAAPRAPLQLALVCEEADLAGVRQLQGDVAKRSQLAPELPDFLSARLKAMERLRKWSDYINRAEAFLFYHGSVDRGRLELIWRKSESSKPAARRGWFLAEPDLAGKITQYPDGLSTVDDVIRFAERSRSASV